MSEPRPGDTFNELFANKRTSLDDIHKAGWRVYHSSGGGWWFDHVYNADGTLKRDGRPHQFLPFWMLQLCDRYYEAGREETAARIRDALGLQKQTPRKKQKRSKAKEATTEGAEGTDESGKSD